ncbi:MAG: response regulator [Proteobacteria bacterium]|nr:response regulator [Pseudomonadota bacterium]
MSDGLDVIIVDDEPSVCDVINKIVSGFYVWGDVMAFKDADEAMTYCLNREVGIAIFIVDVFLGGKSGFYFLDTIAEKFTSVHEDTIIITGQASDDVVNMCIASGINYLLEKPIRSYALQLAVRAIMTKYLKFARKLLQDPYFAGRVAGF